MIDKLYFLLFVRLLFAFNCSAAQLGLSRPLQQSISCSFIRSMRSGVSDDCELPIKLWIVHDGISHGAPRAESSTLSLSQDHHQPLYRVDITEWKAVKRHHWRSINQLTFRKHKFHKMCKSHDLDTFSNWFCSEYLNRFKNGQRFKFIHILKFSFRRSQKLKRAKEEGNRRTQMKTDWMSFEINKWNYVYKIIICRNVQNMWPNADARQNVCILLIHIWLECRVASLFRRSSSPPLALSLSRCSHTSVNWF